METKWFRYSTTIKNLYLDSSVTIKLIYSLVVSTTKAEINFMGFLPRCLSQIVVSIVLDYSRSVQDSDKKILNKHFFILQ